jgi:hypothetical protein
VRQAGRVEAPDEPALVRAVREIADTHVPSVTLTTVRARRPITRQRDLRGGLS